MKQQARRGQLGNSGTVRRVAKPVVLSREAFIAAAVALVDREGLEALTLKRVGKELAASHTALYRYFDGIPSLLAGVREELLRQIVLEPLTASAPRDKIIEFAFKFRQIIVDHPNLAPAFVSSSGEPESVVPPSVLVIEQLEQLGMKGDLLTGAYQALESYVVGGSVWDYSGAPRFHEVRQIRLRLVRHKDFDRVTRDDRALAKNTEDAFRLGLECLLDGLIARI